jgi:peptidoglycan/xylan/chitin deacetylase (PgdA/CDA1 family)
MKRALLATLTRDAVVDFLRPLRPRAASVFCLHRFADPDLGNEGHDLAALRRNLAFLRRHRVPVVSLSDLVTTLERGEQPRPGTVVFTIDDGYADFANAAAPIFAEFDCPATVFVVTGFLDGGLWLWWDRIEYIFRETDRTGIALDIEGVPYRGQWSTPRERQSEAERLAEALEAISDESKQRILAEIATTLEVTPPETPPARFAAMSWDDARRCERMGVTFGPHTVTHPILSRVSDDAAAFEIRESWRRLREQMAAPTSVFCYPNGGAPTFGERERRLVRDGGLRAAVTTARRYVTQKEFAAGADARFVLPRFAYYDDLPHFAQPVSGVERVKSMVRALGTR